MKQLASRPEQGNAVKTASREAEKLMKKSLERQNFCAFIAPIFRPARKMAELIQFLGGMPRNADCKFVTCRLLTAVANSRESEGWNRMDIRFVSSLTSEDEKLFAPALLKAVAALLDQLPIAYTVRIETTGAEVFQHAHAVTIDEPTKADIFEAASGNGRSTNHYLGRVVHS